VPGTSVDEGELRVPDFTCAFNQVLLKYRDLFPCAPGAFAKLLPSEGADPIEPLERYLRDV
jgi:hypothetical protein